MASFSKLEDLSDELLMIIIGDSGDVYSIFRAYSALNDRFNRILLDPRAHLFANYLALKHPQQRRNFYSKSSIRNRIGDDLRRISHDNQEQQLEDLFRRLISMFFEERLIDTEKDFRLKRERFENKRSQLSAREKQIYDEELKSLFGSLSGTRPSSWNLSSMIELVRDKGASLQCEHNELTNWNVAQAINRSFIDHIDEPVALLRSLLDLFRYLFISNPELVRNRDYVGNGGLPTYLFLIYYLYRLKNFYSVSPASWAVISVNQTKYQLIVELLLDIFQAILASSNPCVEKCLFHCLESISAVQYRTVREKLLTSQYQLELFQLFCRKYHPSTDDEQANYSIFSGIRNILHCERMDLFRVLFDQTHFVRQLFEQDKNSIGKLINIVTGTRRRRKFFREFLSSSEHSIPLWFIDNDLIFILLKKKECDLIKTLIQLVPALVHRLDDQGNDPLLFLLLHVRGCRHRLIQFFLHNGSDYQRCNMHHENFFQLLQLPQNATLLHQLLDHEILRYNQSTLTIVSSALRE